MLRFAIVMRSTDVMAALGDAACDGDLARLRVVLKTGIDVDVRYPGGKTALHGAAFNGHTACLEALLSGGVAEPNVGRAVE